MSKSTYSFGPGVVITAAFIGPGTVITCTTSGVAFKTALLWALLFSCVATIVLQEMSLRLSLVTGKDLTYWIRHISRHKWINLLSALVGAGGIVVGCIAFQAGNLTGGASGLKILYDADLRLWVGILSVTAASLLLTGTYRIIERVMFYLVAIMSASFLITALANAPKLGELLSGIFIPSLPEGSLLNVIALIGTTVVPYNLFLHSRIVREKWVNKSVENIETRSLLKFGRLDLSMGVIIGVLISMAIMISSAGFATSEAIKGIKDLADPLRNSLGPSGSAIFGIGLLAAGLTSAITAPLAAAFTLSGALGWKEKREGLYIKIASVSILLVGMAFALANFSPIGLIISAQALNGVILPFVSLFLIITLNSRKSMGEFANAVWSNILAGGVLLVVFVLSGRMILKSLGLM